MQVSVIDLGSNSIRLVIYKWNGKKLVKIQDVKRQAKSMKYIYHNQMSFDGIENIISTLKELILISKALETNDIRIFATAAIRNIENSVEVRKTIESEIKYKIDVLESFEESLLGFEGIKQTLQLPDYGVCVDIGGGSTEITYFKDSKAIYSDSIPIGSLNLYLNFVDNVLPSIGEQFLIRLEIRRQLDHIEWLKKIESNTIIGIGGSLRAIFKLHKANYNLDESIYEITLNHEHVNNYAQLNKDNYAQFSRLIVNTVPERLTTVVPGLMILDEILLQTKAKEFILSPYGVREGYLFNRVLGVRK